jgi:membrane fusion protein, multidrug efflux system
METNPSHSRRPIPRKLLQYLWPVGIVLALLGGLFFTDPFSQAEPLAVEAPAGPPPGMPVEAAAVIMAPISREVTAVGTLHADEAVVIASEIAGRVVEIAFAEGAPVRSGQVLLRLESSVQNAELSRAKASLALSEANYQRAEGLLRDEAIAKRERDEAYAQWQLDEANVRLSEAQLAKTVLRAPFNGVIGLRSVSVGGYLRPGDAVASLSAVDPIKVDFRIAEGFARSLRKGQAIKVMVDAVPGENFSGQVYAIDPRIDSDGRSVLLRAKVVNPQRQLNPGMFARVALVLEERPTALLVPEEALIAQGAQQLVYKVVDGLVEAVPVTLGLRQQGRVEVTEGLSAGDVVITAGQMKVRPGMPVMVMPPPAALSKAPAARIGG